MKFKSQICTSRKQSKRLLELGLKEATSDMKHKSYYENNMLYEYIYERKTPLLSQEVPAWSLHRLIEICSPSQIEVGFKNITYYYEGREYGINVFESSNDVYDNLIDCIEWLIKEKRFNESYIK